MTLRAAGLIRSVDTLCLFRQSREREQFAEDRCPAYRAGAERVAAVLPSHDGVPVADPGYKARSATSMKRRRLRSPSAFEPASRRLLAEGDPFFYGSFMHIWRRLVADFPVEVVPGVTGFSGCSARAGAPLTWGDDILTVLPGTLDEAALDTPSSGDRCRRHHEGRAQSGEGAPCHFRCKPDRQGDLCRARRDGGRAHYAAGGSGRMTLRLTSR